MGRGRGGGGKTGPGGPGRACRPAPPWTCPPGRCLHGQHGGLPRRRLHRSATDWPTWGPAAAGHPAGRRRCRGATAADCVCQRARTAAGRLMLPAVGTDRQAPQARLWRHSVAGPPPVSLPRPPHPPCPPQRKHPTCASTSDSASKLTPLSMRRSHTVAAALMATARRYPADRSPPTPPSGASAVLWELDGCPRPLHLKLHSHPAPPPPQRARRPPPWPSLRRCLPRTAWLGERRQRGVESRPAAPPRDGVSSCIIGDREPHCMSLHVFLHFRA